MFLEQIPYDVKTTTLVKVRYDCNGDFERCGKEWTLKHKDAKANFIANEGKHICRQCQLKSKNPMKRKEVQEKVKQTTLERYGTACVMNTAENIVKRNEKMFGAEETIQNIIKKRRKTSQERYGTDHPMQSEEVQDKQKAVLQEKYGVDHPLQNTEILKKMQATNLKRHGVKNVASLPEVQVKMAQTTLEKYGVEHYNQLPEMKDYLRENCSEWLKGSYEAGGPNKGVKRPEEWSQKQSESMAKLITSGEWKGGGWKNALKGHYNAAKCLKPNPMFRSSLELMVHRYLDLNGDVEFYDYEPFGIPYMDDEGHSRRYIPDFIVKFKGQANLIIIEVKPNYMLEVAETQSKLKSAFDLCKQHENVEYLIWGKEKAHSLGYTLESLLELPEVTLLGE